MRTLDAVLYQFTGLYDKTGWYELTRQEKNEWLKEGNLPSEWKGKPIYEGDKIRNDKVCKEYKPELKGNYRILVGKG